MRNILAHVPHKGKEQFASGLKEIWRATNEEDAKIRTQEFIAQYKNKYPKATKCLEEGLDDSLSYYAFPQTEANKTSSANMPERLNREIRRRTRVVGIFPNGESYTKHRHDAHDRVLGRLVGRQKQLFQPGLNTFYNG